MQIIAICKHTSIYTSIIQNVKGTANDYPKTDLRLDVPEFNSCCIILKYIDPQGFLSFIASCLNFIGPGLNCKIQKT